MKLRYYLRGIGLGIIVAAAICICASLRNKNAAMTDAEVIARAEALGMVEQGATLADNTDSEATEAASENSEPDESFVKVDESEIAAPAPATEDKAEEALAEDTKEAEDTEDEATELSEEEPVEEELAEETEETAEEAVDEQTNTAAGEIVTINVEKGNGSDTVARKLAEAGLVANAGEYDKYLMANGYDRRIAAGVHKIPKGAGNEEIAKLLVTKQD